MSKILEAREGTERDRLLREEMQGGEPNRSRSPLLLEQPQLEPTTQPANARQEERDRPLARSTGVIDAHLVSLTAPASIDAEQYLTLRNVIEGKAPKGKSYVVGVSSPTTGDGKTLTAINLAGTLAQSETTRVLLIDADLRAPSVASLIGLSGASGPGLVELVSDPGLSLEHVSRSSPRPNLTVVPAGRSQTQVYETLSSSRLSDLVDYAREQFDYVVVDMPPLLPISDCRLIGRCVDALVVVVAAHRTPRKLVEESLRETQPDKLLGFVLNNADTPLPGGYYYPLRGSRDGNVKRPSRLRRWLHLH